MQMAHFPKYQFENTVSFHHTGLDYFGLMFIKEKKYRNRGRVKVYDCVSICLSTKVVHIEIISDMTTEAFVPALR